MRLDKRPRPTIKIPVKQRQPKVSPGLGVAVKRAPREWLGNKVLLFSCY